MQWRSAGEVAEGAGVSVMRELGGGMEELDGDSGGHEVQSKGSDGAGARQ